MDRSVFKRMAQNEARHWWFRGRRRIVSLVLREILSEQKYPQILDAGCGSGGNLELLSGFGSVSAFEHDDIARNTAANRSSLDVHPGTLPGAVPTFETPFDVITLLDVLEHVTEDQHSLETLSKLLATDGNILITVPALPELWSEHDVTHQHKRRYTRETLTNVCEAAGLTVKHVRYFNTLLLPLAKLHRKYCNKQSQSSDEDELPPICLNGMLYAIFTLESFLFRLIRFPTGLSLVAVAKRS